MNANGQLKPPPDVFITPLLELRDYYAGLTQEYQRLFIEARSQLDHVEALLSTWSFANDDNQLSPLHTTNQTISAGQQDSLFFLSSDDGSEFDHDDSDFDLLESSELELANSQQLTPADEEQTDTASVVAVSTPSPDIEIHHPFIKGAEVPMLPQYQALRRMDAIRRLLHEYTGTVCHIDFIVRSLYGELESTLFKIVKGRVQSSLTQGRERGYWSAIPNEPGCYTLDLSLLAPSTSRVPKSIQPKKKKAFLPPKTRVVPMLRQFDGLFLIDAITSFLEQHQGKVFSVNQVVNGIYGELDAEDLREVKNKVLNELSRGHRIGRFSRVPDQIGLYTWDARRIIPV
jgi:hypothetical protein